MHTGIITTVTTNSANISNVVRHEMGHVIGLRHPWETSDYDNSTSYPSGPAALMYPVTNSNWTTFQDYDLDEFYKTYPQRGATPDA